MTDDTRAAAQLDAEVDEALAGGPVDPLLGGLVEAHRVEPDAALAARVGQAVRRGERQRWLPVQAAAAALGLSFMFEGVGNLFIGRWVARHAHTPFDAHGLFEGGIVFVALASVLLAAVMTRRWLDLAVVTGVPVGLALAIHGASELGEFPAGGALHLSQGTAALALALLWWWTVRYAPPPHPK